LVFPQIFFPAGNPTVAIIASLATYGVGYVARPIGGFVLGNYGDTHGRKNVLLICMFLMGISTMLVGLLPTYAQAGCWRRRCWSRSVWYRGSPWRERFQGQAR
jgi:MFS family permease